MAKEDAEIEVCVGNYASYNSGYLVDRWVALPMTDAELDAVLGSIRAEAQRLTGEIADEMYISDVDGKPLGIPISEYSSVHSLNTLAKLMADLDEHQKRAAEAYIDNMSSGTFEEYANVLMQADDVAYYSYSRDYTYKGDDPTLAAIIDSRTPEFKYGEELLDANPELKAILDASPAASSAFDVERYGKFASEMDDVILYDDGYLESRESLDLNMYTLDDIAEHVSETWDAVHAAPEAKKTPGKDIAKAMKAASRQTPQESATRAPAKGL